MLDEFVPDKVPIDTLQAVLRLLLEERVSIRNLPLIFEAIAEAHAPQASAEVHLRARPPPPRLPARRRASRRPTARCR